ncbi:P1 family peptidase [Psychromonas aquatilis]|uniref:P1 family peptidase n=1 Tax=Psychromonas aquatilis TaxID=2005072 RepID=A0ABU9GQL6_9GAMM
MPKSNKLNSNSLDSICDVPGIKVGHAQDRVGGTGCTVILPDEDAVCGVDVAGGGPGTRETDALNPVNLIEKIQGLYLSGGSAYGLAGADGVMRWCEENNRGYDVGIGCVPIVPGAVLFDLPVADFHARPDREMGYQACLNATAQETRSGNIGAGTGASVGKVGGMDLAMKGGLGTASLTFNNIVIGAIVAVNCLGDVIDPNTGNIIAGALTEDKSDFVGTMNLYKKMLLESTSPQSKMSNTTIGAIATNAALTKSQATKVSMMAHDGFARVINPIHTLRDGDTIFTLSTGQHEADVSVIGALAAEVMAIAVLRAVRAAESCYGLKGLAS